MATLKDALEIIKQLSKEDLEVIREVVLNESSSDKGTLQRYTEDNRFSEGRTCPLCRGTHIVRNGTRKALEVWKQYIDCMMNGLSIRKTAKICNIHRNTVFIWRHKILDALQNMHNEV